MSSFKTLQLASLLFVSIAVFPGANGCGGGGSADPSICTSNNSCAAFHSCIDNECVADNPVGADPISDLDLLPGDLVPDVVSIILDDIPGYASGTVGGRDGTIYFVTNLEPSGPGSLRYGVESEEPLWILFQDGLNGTIQLDQTIYAKSYKTIDARGHQITLKGVRSITGGEATDGWHETGISLGQKNDKDTVVQDVVFLNLTFDGNWPEPDVDSEGSDGIHLQNRVHNVWIHQCTFHNWIDGGIDARNDDDFDLMPRNISITNSHFYNINQGLLLEAQRVTFARNFCDNINVRCVKTIDGGRAHVVNNVIKNWRGAEIVYAKNDSQLLVDHNIFRPGDTSRQAGRLTGGGQNARLT